MSTGTLSPRGPHLVSFYDDDRVLCEAVARFIRMGAKDNEVAIIVARPEHCEEIEAALQAAGSHPGRMALEGRLVIVDAVHTLEQFMRGDLDRGDPDATLFRRTIRGLIDGALVAGRPVRAYGEMVDVLLERGNERAMLALEGLWNDLLGEIQFQLYCAYRLGRFSDTSPLAPFESVCRMHSHLMPLVIHEA